MVDNADRRVERRHRDASAYARTPGEREWRLVIHGDPQILRSTWFKEVVERSVRLRLLQDGWAGPATRAVEVRVLEWMISDVLPSVMPAYPDATAPQIVPTRDGGVQMEWHRGGWDVEVALSPYGGWVNVERADGTDMWEGPISDNLDGLRVVLKEIA